MTIQQKLLASYQNCKKLTRLGCRNPFKRVLAGAWASMAGKLVWLSYILFRPSLPKALSGEGAVVISLTSFPKRMKYLWMVIDLLMRQDVAPAGICLCLCRAEFEGTELPKSLDPYLERGLRIIWTDEKLRSHLKYWEIFQKEDRCVITVDDDLFYAKDTVSRLLELHSKFPYAVCANITRRICGDDYSSWDIVLTPGGPSSDLLAMGFGGVLYPPSFYCRKELFDKELIKKTCLKADDLWLKFQENGAGIGVVTGEFCAVPPEIPSSQSITLSKDNVKAGGNNVAWKMLHSEN